MTDAALIWDAETSSADLSLTGADLTTEAGLSTAIVISLFTDARAEPDDVLPQENADRRGWWGDHVAGDGDRIGSRLWLLAREKRLPIVLAKAREYSAEALAWLVRDGVAASIDVETETTPEGWLAIAVFTTRPGGPRRQRFDYVWKGVALAVQEARTR